jgi:predicted 3-demethylubiquinone-9 3-methyltransferase (glyoxalase superfamily)
MATLNVRPFLMFQGNNAEQAMQLYVSLIPRSQIVNIVRYGAAGPGAEGSVMKATLSIAGQEVMCIDSPVKHAFSFTPSFSFFVDCESEQQLREIAAALGEGGGVLMELANYGFSRQFTWLNDRYGVSWQLNLPNEQ